METSQIFLNNGLIFLVIATGVIIFIVGGFLVKLLIDLSKLTKNVDDTTSIIKSEIEPTLKEFNQALKSINAIAKSADEKVDSIAKLFETVLGTGNLIFTRVKKMSGGVIKNFIKGLIYTIKFFVKK